VLFGALHLANIIFEGGADDSAFISSSSTDDLKRAEELMGIEAISPHLIEKEIQAGAEKMTLQLKPLQATHARDALIKQLYVRIFDHLVHDINEALRTGAKSMAPIGLLDVFGFECFRINSFEQLCINYANERLHSFFMDQVFKDEIALYTREGLPIPDVNPPDNAEVCAIFDQKNLGAFQLLDSQLRVAKPSDSAFCREMHTNHTPNQFFGGKATGDDHRGEQMLTALKLTMDEAFVVHHFAASVVYATEHFLDKNDNKLSDSFEASLRQSTQPFIADVIRTESAVHHEETKSAGGPRLAAPPALPGGSGFSSVGKTFLNELRKLMRELQATQPHFVRCFKPTKDLAKQQMDGQMVLTQMASSGLLEAVKLMQVSYPSRSTYEELLRLFGTQLPKSTQSLPQAKQVEVLLYGTTAEPHEYCLGKQLIFFTFKAGHILEELRSTPIWMIRPRMVERLEAKAHLSSDEQVLLTELKELIRREILDRARRRKEALFIAVCVGVKLMRRTRVTLAARKRAATRVEAQVRGNIGRIEGRKRRAKREAERRVEMEANRKAKAAADLDAEMANAEAAEAEAEAAMAEAAAMEALALAEEEAAAEAEALAELEEAAAEEAAAEAAVTKKKKKAEAEALAATARGKREKAQKTAREAADKESEAAKIAAVEENPAMVDVNGVRCYQAILCTGGTGIFQRHNFEGMWTLADSEEVSGGHPHYEHRTPNGQVVHLFHVHSAYGGAPRWVIGPVPGNENGWGFVDTSASHPEVIAEKWMVWMETSWEESKRLAFRGLEKGATGDWNNFVEEEDDDDEDDDEEEAPTPVVKKKPKKKPAEGGGEKPKAEGGGKKKKKAAEGGGGAKGGEGGAKGGGKKKKAKKKQG